MKRYALLGTAFAVASLVACPSGAGLETRTFALKYLSSGEAASIIDPYVYTDRPKAGGRISMAGNTISVRETHDNLERIARVLEQYDRPQPTVQLTFRVIAANGGPGATTDPAIADVEAVLRRLFRFRSYGLVGEGVVGGIEGSSVTQSLGGPGETYQVTARLNRVRLSGDSGTVQLEVRMVTLGGELESVVTLPMGKTAVLGNARAAPGKRTVILTVRPELVTPSP